MRSLLLVFTMVIGPLLGSALAADVSACTTRHAELSAKAAQFQGETMMKRLIQADLDRAARELIEGDDDECNEALDHATKLLDGKV